MREREWAPESVREREKEKNRENKRGSEREGEGVRERGKGRGPVARHPALAESCEKIIACMTSLASLPPHPSFFPSQRSHRAREPEQSQDGEDRERERLKMS